MTPGVVRPMGAKTPPPLPVSAPGLARPSPAGRTAARRFAGDGGARCRGGGAAGRERAAVAPGLFRSCRGCSFLSGKAGDRAPGPPRSRRGCPLPPGAAGGRVIEVRRDGVKSAAGGGV